MHQEQDWAAAVEVLGHNAGISVSERLSPARQAAAIAELLAGGALVGVRAGRSEYGPRALGQGSVLADPRSPSSHERVNTFKKREPFRPYAPSILAEHATQYFEAPSPSPFMSFSSFLRRERIPEVPAVAHVDGSARYHTVDEDGGPLRGILEAFLARTGVPVVLNTSFNRHGEPIVESPADAVRAFVETDLDALALGPFLALKRGSGIP